MTTDSDSGLAPVSPFVYNPSPRSEKQDTCTPGVRQQCSVNKDGAEMAWSDQIFSHLFIDLCIIFLWIWVWRPWHWPLPTLPDSLTWCWTLWDGEKIPGVEGERDTLITWNHEEIEQLCFSIVFNGFMFLLFRAKSVTILFPKVKGTIYHIVFVTFLSRVLSGITTTHRQPSLIIETGKHQNQPRYSLLCSEL